MGEWVIVSTDLKLAMAMEYPKIARAEAMGDRILRIEFTNQEIKDYDISPLLEKPMFSPLQEPACFKNFIVEPGGHAIVWNDELDISEYELWKNGTVEATIALESLDNNDLRLQR